MQRTALLLALLALSVPAAVAGQESVRRRRTADAVRPARRTDDLPETRIEAAEPENGGDFMTPNEEANMENFVQQEIEAKEESMADAIALDEINAEQDVLDAQAEGEIDEADSSMSMDWESMSMGDGSMSASMAYDDDAAAMDDDAGGMSASAASSRMRRRRMVSRNRNNARKARAAEAARKTV